jgi:hypothetical protein
MCLSWKTTLLVPTGGKPAAQLSSLETHEAGVLESLKKFCGMKFVCEFFP